MPTTFREWLDQIEHVAENPYQKGVLFERFMAAYLITDPLYANQLEAVWRYPDWPDRPEHWKADNLGFDLVARTQEGSYWAIQCKFYDAGSRIDKAAVTNFTHDSEREFVVDGKPQRFAYRLLVATQDALGKQAEEATTDLPDFGVLHLRELELAPIDWSRFDWGAPEKLVRKPGKSLRAHQREAIVAVREGFRKHDRGQLIMACGTGKTYTSLKLMEQEVPETGLVLFLAPSITLVSQTLREWAEQADTPLHAFVVCSDSQVGQAEEDPDIRVAELAYPATTDAQKLVEAIRGVGDQRRRVIFSTYQSIQVVIDAQKQGKLPTFDLVICDEAHRTTGVSVGDYRSDFVKVHRDDLLRAKKRLYMTATPRIYTEKTREKADEKQAILYSMDDEATYGPEFFNLNFGDAASRGILSEYRVIIVAMQEEAMAELANEYNAAYKLDDKKAITVEFATRILGAWKGLTNHNIHVLDGAEETIQSGNPMRRAVAFSRSISASEQVRDAFGRLVELALQRDALEMDEPNPSEGMLEAAIQHVDGTMGMGKRLAALDWLKEDPGEHACRVLSNARCLSEGVDVPALDAVIFFDTRESMVDIVQAVGRVMRKAPGKDVGYIILPIAIPSKEVINYDTYIDKDPRFKSVWKVIKALRAHDERLVDKSEYTRRMQVMDGGGWSKKERKKRSGSAGEGQMPMDLLQIPVEQIRDALYAVIPKHLGDSEYWASWAKDVAHIAETIIERIEALLDKREGRAAFNAFLKAIRKNLNGGIGEQEAIEMLAQHVITRPIFDALFAGQAFSQENPVSQAMQRILDVLDKHGVDAETDKMERFYRDVGKRAALAKSDEARQDLIRNLYDTFFNEAFPSLADRLGIVYTPIEVVDFILHSVDRVLQDHFGTDLGDESVQVLDPFTGTGTFIVRLLQSRLIRDQDLPRKYGQELHANELVLLAYYIAAINIESAYHARTLEHRPFEGIVLADTFQMGEAEQSNMLEGDYLRRNSERAERQKKIDIRVIVSNPPYSSGQKSENDNNQNDKYDRLDSRIRATYAKESNSGLIKNVYDSYIRAIRWASDRIGNQGVIGFVTNGSFIDANNMDGLRKCLEREYSRIYVCNLRGNQRTSGEQSRKEGGKIFGSGSRTPVAITILIKDPAHPGPAEIHYHDIGDYKSREEKLDILRKARSIEGLSWTRIIPNEDGDWTEQRSEGFAEFLPLGDKSSTENTIFSIYSQGVLTARDAWAYNQSRTALIENMRAMIAVYNRDRESYHRICKGLSKDIWPKVEDVITTDPEQISWTRALKADLSRDKPHPFEEKSLRRAMYRPFSAQWMYFSRQFNEMVYQIPRLFPTERQENVVISVTGIGATKDFSALTINTIPNYHFLDTGQCFPLYWYETVEEADKRLSKAQTGSLQMGLLDQDDPTQEIGTPDADGYIRREAITDWALEQFRRQYGDDSLTKRDIFHYIYGLLHSPEYRAEYAADLKKMLPRIPFTADFWAFSRTGKALMDLHLAYETVEPWPLEEHWASGKSQDYTVEKIKFPKKGERDRIVYNPCLTLSGIPEEAYAYEVNGKSAIEWVMERYSVRVDKASGIVNDPNAMLKEVGNPRYIVELLKRLVRVSVETQRLVASLPALEVKD